MSFPPLDTAADPDTFRTAIESALCRLQKALRAGLSELGVKKTGPTAIGRILALDKSIAWKVGHMAKAKDGLLAFNFLPGQAGMRIVLDAFLAADLSTAQLEELTEALGVLEEKIVEHAGDRRTAAAMIRAILAGEEERPLDEGLRRSHFRTTSSIWGAEARVQFKADFIAPSAKAASFDLITIEGFDSLLRLRPGISWPVARKRFTKEGDVESAKFEPLQPQADGAQDAPLLLDYCSEPVPEFDAIQDTEGFTNYILRPGQMGKPGATTCMIGTLSEAAIYAEDYDDYLNLITGVHLRTPCELLVFDLFLHKSIAHEDLPTAELFGQLRLGPTFPHMREDHALPVDFYIEELSTAGGEQALLEIPNYSQSVTDTFQLAAKRLGSENWNRDDFVGYRVRLAFPPIPSLGNFIFKVLPKR